MHGLIFETSIWYWQDQPVNFHCWDKLRNSIYARTCFRLCFSHMGLLNETKSKYPCICHVFQSPSLQLMQALTRPHTHNGSMCSMFTTNASLWRKHDELPPSIRNISLVHISVHWKECTTLTNQVNHLICDKVFSQFCTKAMKEQNQIYIRPTA